MNNMKKKILLLSGLFSIICALIGSFAIFCNDYTLNHELHELSMYWGFVGLTVFFIGISYPKK